MILPRALFGLGVVWVGVALGACFSDGGGVSTGVDGDGSGTGEDADGSGTSSTASGSATGSGTSAGTSTTSGTSDTAGDCPDGGACVDLPPADWMGPVVRHVGVDASEECPSDHPSAVYDGFADPTAEDAVCGACSCGDPSGVTCAGPLVRLYANSGQCGLGRDDMVQLAGSDQCVAIPNPTIGASANSDPILPEAGTGSCAPGGGGVDDLPPVTWGQLVRACGGSTSPAACGEGGMCVPAPTDPFEPEICVYQSGDVACPGGTYVKKIVAYGDVDDTRDCSACGCNPPAGSTCEGIIELHQNAFCSNLQETIQNPGTECVDLTVNGNPDPPLSAKMIVFDTVGGQCVTSGGQPNGEVAPIEPTTFCCTP